MFDRNPRPPFMNGLLTAKSILVGLKQKKMKENKQKFVHISNDKKQQMSEIRQSNSKGISQQLKKQQQIITKTQKKQQLSQKINQIGNELYELNQQIQTYEVIFYQLIHYYQQNHKIVEDNDHLKRKSFQLEEKIKNFKNKIRDNYQKIQINQREGFQILTLLQRSLQEFMISQKERALIEPLPKIKQTKYNQQKLLLNKQPQMRQNNLSINLNWRNLSQKVIKKPVARKPKATQEMRQSLFNSQIYNI